MTVSRIVRWVALAMLPAAPLAALAQGASKVPRVAIFTLGFAPDSTPVQAFRNALREHGYIEGKTISVEYVFAEGQVERLPALASQLARSKVDVIVTEGTPTALAAKQATATIPIVTAVVTDPVKLGLVSSLSRPDANITGVTFAAGDRGAKQLELIKEVVAKGSRVGVIYNAAIQSNAERVAAYEPASRSLGLQLKFIAVRAPADLDMAFDSLANAQCAAFITMGDGMLWGQRRRIVEFSRKQRLPAAFPEREFADEGGLIAYGPSLNANFRRAAAFVDKLLKGARPADLPIEQPTTVNLVINLKTAKLLGLKIPHALLVRADEVIQ
jgi:putative ABC transport system substrate-binding protein